ncbi:MAG: hypothetical protein KZQ70_11205 [gamma proteobacterium symbiont of Lucinoma myriamae]|nr:hypothetical protein [gamma proteobacterium symbiont of Lucinoma myriamae]
MLNSTIQKTQIKLNCEFHFGVSSLNNSSLINHFFPEDLPEDWRFSYYSNEFNLLAIHLSDLNLSSLSAQNGVRVSGDEIIEQLTDIFDDIEKTVFCLFDCSKLSESIKEQLFDSQIATKDNCYFINLDKPGENFLIGHSTHIEWLNACVEGNIEETVNSDLFCKVKSDKRIEPVELKLLIEHIQDYALRKDARTVSVVFSSDYALENCRNAILLESMM